ncbi:single-stranded-DNA-specific exonuclease RecJ [Desulfotomaculum sp. 1211_IL3151]|uniref:single-stranded-DNA-specific exonuclease RecJ n=1 Tax=Desulfotomaculum sp. 1211_IL3151 TaxID=3084055 RepID=UPI002FDA5343
MRRQKKWHVRTPNPALQQILSMELGISKILAQLLINRGIYTVDQAKAFLGSELDQMFSPWLMQDMEKAVKRILTAREKGEPILVYGDYDVDGITGTTVLVLALRRLGCQVEYFIPHRLEEGYGLNKEALERAAERGIGLVVTVDCGISGVEEVAVAQALGVDIVITDHHEPPLQLPAALAVLDPKREDCSYPFKELAGVGVALKLIQGLFEQAGLGQQDWEKYIDLVCLGTVADIVPLQGENRILVKYGLPQISSGKRPGLQALIKVSGIRSEVLGTRELGFGLAPRLNAAGRMGDAGLGVELLLAEDSLMADNIAEELNRGNQERQQVESKVLAEALALLEADPELAQSKVLVLASENWHPGVIGIVASRLVDRFYRPTFMISLEAGRGKGSARSIAGFNLYQAMVKCQDHLEQFGGHAMAAGFSIQEEKITDFREAVNRFADEALTEEHLTPNLDLDALINLTELSMDTVQELNQLSPLGHCNPGPMLGCCQATVVNCREVGKNGGHLKMRVREKQTIFDGIGFNLASYSEMLAANDTVDMAFVPSINVWNGRSSVQLEVKELKETGEVPPLVQKMITGERELKTILSKFLYLPEEKIAKGLIPLGLLQLLTPEYQEYTRVACKQGDFQILDYRNCPDRLAQLVQLVNSEETSLIVVESTAQAIQIATFLSEGERNVGVYHPGLNGSEAEQLKTLIHSGRISLLVATAFSNLPELHFEQVILYYLPYQPAECQLYCATASKVALLGGENQVSEAQEQIYALAPERNALAEVFKLIRQRLNQQGHGEVTAEELYVCLRSFYPKASIHTAEICLNAFQEMGLLTFNKQGNTYHYQLNLQARGDLESSPTFNWTHQMKEDCQRFQRQYLAATGQELKGLFLSSL